MPGGRGNDTTGSENQQRSGADRRITIDRHWVVLLEAEALGGDEDLPPAAVGWLLQALSDHEATIVCQQRRCTVQLRIEATSGAEALFSAAARWRDAARTLGLPAWPLARAEVLTLKEFQRQQVDPMDRVLTAPTAAGAGVRESPHDDLLPRALQDSLTGLVNRELFADCVRSVLADEGPTDDQWVVLVLDLDSFGALNRSAGAALGDRLLALLASRIRRIPEHTMVARLGGDEFAVLARETKTIGVDQLATRLLEAIRAPMELGGRSVAVTASVGVATSAHMSHPDDLIREAAVAMCIAKAGGGDCWRGYDAGASVDVKRLDFDADPAPDRLAYVLLLERAALAANECQTLEEAAAIVLQQVCTHTGWSLGRLSVVGSTGEWVEPTALWHTRGPDRFEPFRRACDATSRGGGPGLEGAVLNTATSLSVFDGADAGSVPADVAAAAAAVGIKSGFAFPIVVGGDVLAVLEFFSVGTGRLNDALYEVLGGVCAQLGRVAERSRARTALARSEERYRSLADSVPVLMWVSGRDCKCSMLNSAWLDFTGRTLEQELGDGWAEGIHPDDVDRCREIWATAFERREPFELDYRLRRADGEYRIIFDRGGPIGTGDDFQGFVGGCIDVSDRRHAETSLRDREARLRALIATSGAMIVLLRADATLIADYQGACDGMGYPEGSMSGRPGFDFVHPDDLARTADAFAAALAKPGLTEPFQCRVRHADGPWRWVEAVGNNLLGYPPVQAIVISAVDITKRKAAEDALAEAELRLRQREDRAYAGLWHWDVLTGDVCWSDEMYQIFGVASPGAGTPEKAAAERDVAASGVHPADRVPLAEVLATIRAGHSRGLFEYRVVRPDGQVRQVQGRAMVVRDAAGKPTALSGTLRDVTADVASGESPGHRGAA